MEELLYQTSDRFVIFLDIMGFKDRVARNKHEELYRELTVFNKDITNIINKHNAEYKKGINKFEDTSDLQLITETNSGIQLVQFSDSIILFSSTNSQDDLKRISDVARQIMLSAIERERPIPLKGALAEGLVTCDTAKQLFFGQALIDAYLLEENVQYYGIVVHHSAESSVIKLDSSFFEDKEVFLKNGKIKHYELVCYSFDNDLVQAGLKKIRLSVSDAPRRYIDNTLNIINI